MVPSMAVIKALVFTAIKAVITKGLVIHKLDTAPVSVIVKTSIPKLPDTMQVTHKVTNRVTKDSTVAVIRDTEPLSSVLLALFLNCYLCYLIFLSSLSSWCFTSVKIGRTCSQERITRIVVRMQSGVERRIATTSFRCARRNNMLRVIFPRRSDHDCQCQWQYRCCRICQQLLKDVDSTANLWAKSAMFFFAKCAFLLSRMMNHDTVTEANIASASVHLTCFSLFGKRGLHRFKNIQNPALRFKMLSQFV